MAWFREIQAKITGEILPRDVQACEALNARHAEYHKEIQNRETQKNSLELNGQRMIQQGNILSSEIAQKIELLNLAFQQLYQIWHRRQQVL
jgi:hypothetical protein